MNLNKKVTKTKNDRLNPPNKLRSPLLALSIAFIGVGCGSDSKTETPPPLSPPVVVTELACTDLSAALTDMLGVKSATSELISSVEAVAGTPQAGFRDAISAAVAHCQVDILYGTNEDQNINIRVGLPLNNVDGGEGGFVGTWNGRTQAIGGGGCAGRLEVINPVNAGYVGAGNDTGHTGRDCTPGVNEDGSYNLQFINDFIRNGIHAQVVFMKSVAETYYATKPNYNYWNGASTGGRQGYYIAQEFADELDGILAHYPAIYWTRFQTAQMWGQIVMNELVGGIIDADKFEAATAAAVAACDANDGVVDGVLDDPRTCEFMANDTISFERTTTIPATETEEEQSTTETITLSDAEARAINLIWDGPRNTYGDKIWFGLDRGTPLDGTFLAPGFFLGLNAQVPFDLGTTQFQWNQMDKDFDWKTVTMDTYAEIAQNGSINIADITDTAGDLDAFRASDGKLLTFVGTNDQLIMPRGVLKYYREMASRYDDNNDEVDFSAVQDFYRLFRAPGVGHGFGSTGPVPEDMFDALVDWVENGVAPQTVMTTLVEGTQVIRTRPICPYPTTSIYNGNGDTDDASNFQCGGNLETTKTVCNDVLVEYKQEVFGLLDYTGTGINNLNGRSECDFINK